MLTLTSSPRQLLPPSEENFRFATEAAQLFVWEGDLLNKTVLFSSNAAAMLGYTELPSAWHDLTTTFDAVHPDDRVRVREAILAVIAGGSSDYSDTYRLETAAGSYFWVEARAKVVRDETGVPIRMQGVALNVDDRVRAEESARISQERVQIAVDAADLATWDWHIPTDRVYWNDRHFELFGMQPRPDPMTSEDFARHVHPDDRDAVLARLNEAIARRTVFQAEFRALREDREDGIPSWMSGYGRVTAEENGQPVRMSGVMFDITERKRREADLAFLAEVSQDLVRLTDIDETMNRLGEKIGAYFGLSQCRFVELDAAQEFGIVNYGWQGARAPKIIRTAYRMSDFLPSEFLRRLRVGETIVVRNTATDPLTDPKKFADSGIGSLVTVPFMRDDEWRFWLGLFDSQARDWHEDEIELMRELATRVWTRLERARSDAAAARAERHIVGIIERMGDAYCVLDRDFRIESVNGATERLLGVSRSMLIGRSHWDVFPASVDTPIGQAFQRVVEEGVEQHLTHHYMDEGQDLYIEVDAYPTNEGGVAMFWRDVTERVRAEEALRKSEEKYRTFFNTIDEGISVLELIYDDSGKPIDMRWIEANPAFETITSLKNVAGKLTSQYCSIRAILA